MFKVFKFSALVFLVAAAASFKSVAQKPVFSIDFNGQLNPTEKMPQGFRSLGVRLTDDRFGNEQHACYFYGTDLSYLNLGTSNVLKPRVGSISLWFYIENLSYNGIGYEVNPLILTKSVCEDDFYEAYSLTFKLGTQRLAVTSSFGEKHQASVFSERPLDLGTWYHAVFTWNDSAVQLYVDGKNKVSIGKTFPTHYLEGDSVMIGNTSNAKNQRYFNGAIDDIQIYNHVLTAKEVKDLFEAPNPDRFKPLYHLGIYMLAGLLITFVIVRISAYYYNQKYNADLEHSQMQRRLRELELQVFRSQMDPHFIFNALNSVQDLVLKNNNQKAIYYLGAFSKLLRFILEGNRYFYISIDTEIEIMGKYLQLESLRFTNAFTFSISTDPNINPNQILIPQMLVQPFVENAVWHGLKNKEIGTINIEFTQLTETTVTCIVDDNGIGREAAMQLGVKNEKRRSSAIQLISERMEMMRRETKQDVFFRITDKFDEQGQPCGTKVEINMPRIFP